MFTLSDALQAVKFKPEFSVKDRGDYTVIDYNLNNRETFIGETETETHILQNLRGTAFDNETGEIIRLAYEKFFNYGEFPEVDGTLNFNDSHLITQKMDGSMCAPIYSKSGTVLGTRAGVTDVSKLATDFVSQSDIRYNDFINECNQYWVTPIFEFCSRANRVVIDYPEPMLVLTGIRFINSGEYMTYESVQKFASFYGIPVVKKINSIVQGEFKNFRSGITEEKNSEGVVIRFESGVNAGHMLKLKSSEYVKKHKAVDSIKWDHDICQLILDGLIDDIIPILDNDKAKYIENYREKLMFSIKKKAEEIYTLYKNINSSDRKIFAMEALKYDSKQYLFKLFEDVTINIYDMLIVTGKKKCTNIKNTKEFYSLIGFVP